MFWVPAADVELAEGETAVGYIHHIDRGYDNLVAKLIGLGADIRRVDV